MSIAPPSRAAIAARLSDLLMIVGILTFVAYGLAVVAPGAGGVLTTGNVLTGGLAAVGVLFVGLIGLLLYDEVRPVP